MIVALLLAAAVQAAPAPVPTPTTAPAAAGALTLDTPIEALVANPKAKAVIDADLPKLTAHPSFDTFKAMSLNQLAPYSSGALNDATLAKVKADLAAIN